MLTKDDLHAIGALIKEETDAIRRDMATKSDLVAEREQTRKIVREEVREAVDLNNSVLNTIF